MSVGVAKRIEKLQRSFLWGDGCIKRKIHAVSWEEPTNSASFFVKSVHSLLKAGSSSARVIDEGFVAVVVRGDRANFWSDIKVDGRLLKEAFPRCFALAVNKFRTAHNFGSWSANKNWEWLIPTRRPPFD
ncbi:hypothetical protein QYF36_026099 [Acer negundo]|nr:hypothetical protein QYF36_026099 [Acer negundo]